MPAAQSASSVANCVTATGSSRTSRAFPPALTMPETIARLIIRDERAWSRPTTTHAPFDRVAPNAAPSRAQNSGVSSTLISPPSPYDENRPLRHSPAQITDSFTVDPGSTVLLGQILTPARTCDPLPSTHSSAITEFSSRSESFLMVTLRQTIAWRSRQRSPMYECGQITLLLTLVLSSMTLYRSMTPCSLTCVPALSFTSSPMKAGPSSCTPIPISTLSPIHTVPSRRPEMWQRTLPSSASQFACMYDWIEPMSHQ